MIAGVFLTQSLVWLLFMLPLSCMTLRYFRFYLAFHYSFVYLSSSLFCNSIMEGKLSIFVIVNCLPLTQKPYVKQDSRLIVLGCDDILMVTKVNSESAFMPCLSHMHTKENMLLWQHILSIPILIHPLLPSNMIHSCDSNTKLTIESQLIQRNI